VLSIDECCPANIIHCWLPTQMVESRFNTCLRIHFPPSSYIECTAVFVQCPCFWSSPFFHVIMILYDIIWHYKSLTIINYMSLSMFPHIIGLTSQQTSQLTSSPAPRTDLQHSSDLEEVDLDLVLPNWNEGPRSGARVVPGSAPGCGFTWYWVEKTRYNKSIKYANIISYNYRFRLGLIQ